jgi:naphthoate synthase
MNAFLAGRPPDFQKFRLRAKRELDGYLRGLEQNLNEPPAMRKKA